MARTTSPTVPASSARALSAPRPWLGSTHARAVIAVTLVGLGARGLFLEHSPLWTDEAFMGVLMRRSLLQVLDVVHNDNHPPLQYLVVRLATALANTPTTLRLPSVIAGAAAVPVAVALGRRLGGDRAGIASGGVVALMPLLVLWSRDARMYALATTMVLAMTLALWRAVEDPTPGRVLVFGLTVLAGLYSHYLVALAVPAALASAALFLRPGRGALVRVTGAAAAAALALVPWLVYAQPQFRHAGEPYWSKPFSITGVATTFASLAAHPGPTTLVVAAVLVAAPVMVVLACFAYRAAAVPERRGILYVCGSGLFALAVLFAVSLKKPLLDERFLNLYTTELLPVAGMALAWTGRRWLTGALLLLLLATTVVEVATLPTPQVPAVTAYIDRHVDPGRDVVALNGPTEYFAVLFYGNKSTQRVVRVVDRAVPWYVGLAAFRPGDIVPEVPSPPGTIYLVTNPDQAAPTMPTGVHRTRRSCSPGVCLETWTH